MLSYMAPSVSDKPPTVPGRLQALDQHKPATAYHRFSRPPSITFNLPHDAQQQQQQQREGFGALPAPPVRRAMAKEDSASSIASSVDLIPATHDRPRPANKPVTLKRSVPYTPGPIQSGPSIGRSPFSMTIDGRACVTMARRSARIVVRPRVSRVSRRRRAY